VFQSTFYSASAVHVKGSAISFYIVLFAEPPDHAAIKMFLIVVYQKKARCGKTELLFHADQDGSQNLIQANLLRQQARYPEDGRNGPVLRFQLFTLHAHRASPAFPGSQSGANTLERLRGRS
jgi:hypothetical protein